MKNLKLLLAACVLLTGSIYAMEGPPGRQLFNANIQIYFSPQDSVQIRNELMSLISNAQKAVYVAMYWITDDDLINELIELKKRKKNIQIAIHYDQSSPNAQQYLKKLLQNNIVPIIFPSKKGKRGIMHNKFIIVDFTTVITRSANFTRPAYSPNKISYFNLENILIINSSDVATKYMKNLAPMQDMAFKYYIDMVINNDIPTWLDKLGPHLMTSQTWRFPRIFYRYLDQLGKEDLDKFSILQPRLLNFFRDRPKPFPTPQPSSSIERPRERRQREPEEEKMRQEFEPGKKRQREELATKEQKDDLKRLGYSTEEIEGMTRQKATEIIDTILQ